MNFSYQLKEICSAENINLKEFSEITGIPYKTIRDYSSGSRSPSMGNLQKIASAPRLAKYSHLLLGTEPTDNELDDEINRLWQQMKNEGREEEALSILRYVLERPTNEK